MKIDLINLPDSHLSQNEFDNNRFIRVYLDEGETATFNLKFSTNEEISTFLRNLKLYSVNNHPTFSVTTIGKEIVLTSTTLDCAGFQIINLNNTVLERIYKDLKQQQESMEENKNPSSSTTGTTV